MQCWVAAKKHINFVFQPTEPMGRHADPKLFLAFNPAPVIALYR